MLTSAKDFIQECKEKNYAASTIETHHNSLELFSTWSSEEGISPKQCSTSDTECFIEWLKKQEVPYQKIRADVFRSLESYFSHLVEAEEIQQNPCEGTDIVECIVLDEASRYLNRVRATKADGTIENRELGLIQFTEWLETEVQYDIEECTPLILEDYAIYLKQRDYGGTTIKDRFATVSTLYEFLHKKTKELDENPAEEVNLNDADIVDYRNPTKKSSELAEDIPYVTREQKEQMRNHCPGPKLRNELIIELMWQTGLRRDEVSNILIENIDWDNRQIQIRGKNSKSRYVFYQPSLDTLLDLWIDGGYRSSFNQAENSNYLFPTHQSEQLHPHNINQLIVKAAKNAEVQSEMYTDKNGQSRYKITAHSLRHGFAVRSLKNGMDIKTLADLMGHESLDTTKQYLRLITDDLRERYRKYGPEGSV